VYNDKQLSNILILEEGVTNLQQVWTPSKQAATTIYRRYNTPATPESTVGNHFIQGLS